MTHPPYRHLQKETKNCRGQSLVEAAIIMPLFIFLVMGLIQMSLNYQAHAMLQYAAFRAARTGSLEGMDKNKMLKSALLVMAPVMATNGKADVGGRKVTVAVLRKINSASTLAGLSILGANETVGVLNADVGTVAAGAIFKGLTGKKMMDVLICGPEKNWVRGKFVNHDGAKSASSGEVDFDNGYNTFGFRSESDQNTISGLGCGLGDPERLYNFERTKLKIQLQYQHRMVIPFANAIISQIFTGQQTIKELRLEKRRLIPNVTGVKYDYALAARTLHHYMYVLPMYANYALRMQSNYTLDKLPDLNDCLAPEYKYSSGSDGGSQEPQTDMG